MLFLPAFLPRLQEPTMEVVVHRPNEAQCTGCGCQTFGKILLLITKTAVESTH